MTMVRMMIFIVRKNPFRLRVNGLPGVLWKSHFLVLKTARTLSPWVTGFSGSDLLPQGQDQKGRWEVPFSVCQR